MEATLKFLIIIMLFFVILNSGIIDYIKKKFKLNEPFSKTTNIVLLGDNFFDNNNYTYYNEAISQFLLGKRYTTKILSENNATIKDLPNQIKNIPELMYGRENVLFISIGGNDIMKTYKLEYGNMGNTQLLLDLFDDYKRTLLDISKKTNMTIVLLDLYYPPGKTEYHKHITMWNELLKQFANDRAYSLLEVSEIMNKTPEMEINKITKKIKIFVKVIIKGKIKKGEIVQTMWKPKKNEGGDAYLADAIIVQIKKNKWYELQWYPLPEEEYFQKPFNKREKDLIKKPEIDYIVPIEVSGMDTIENVKYKVQEQEGRITSRVIHLDLYKDEKKLKNNEMLSDHNIQENDTLILKEGETDEKCCKPNDMEQNKNAMFKKNCNEEEKEVAVDECIQQKIQEAKDQSDRLKLLNS